MNTTKIENKYIKLQKETLTNRCGTGGFINKQYENYIDWFRRAAEHSKFMYRFFSVLAMLCPAFIIVFNELTNDTTVWKLAVTITSAIAAFLTAVIQFYRWLDRWTMYRNTSEELKNTCTAFLVEHENPTEKEKMDFFKSMNDIAKRQHGKWEDIQDEQNKRDQKQLG